MTDRTLTALYATQADAEAAKQRLTALGVTAGDIDIHDEASAGRTDGESGMFGGLGKLFGHHEDTHAYAEGLRRGHVLLSAKVDEARATTAAQALDATSAVDLDRSETEWRQSGWTPAAAGTGATAAADTRGDAAIPIVEERLVVGKREVDRGGVRVRSYVVETPVSEQVSLREENVDVQRRAVDRPLGAGEDAFRERTIEMSETGEEAVVGKQAVVTEEVSLRKDVGQRTEEVRDTVRHTEVEVERTDGVRDGAAKRV